MKRLKLFLPLIIFVALGGLLLKGLELDPNEMPSALIDKELPKFSLPSLENPEIMLERNHLLGQVALVNVWATWCPSCRAEHPYLMQISEQEKIPIYGVDYKDVRKDAQQWLRKLGDPYAVNVFDEQGKLGIDLGVFGAPETYLIDHKGVIRYKHIGVVDDQVWLNLLKPLVEQLRAEASQG
ncbi:MAG: DsbE family thiol:disulfide interchange protein [Pseudomonadales bacterium]|nr:DsbE family thiol:disulfide interchange protein [Pseudomonadales bacterium]MCP5213944.1 DsbE family thiol:disulfide interchange protein [Pseudomonadales bacterium]MCP5302846.1 DsbE family thiol:disulfide interchange protein [Pseudomonadales bacterium]